MVNQLMEYADIYRKPSRIVDAYEDDVEIGQVREALMTSFDNIQSRKAVITQAALSIENSR